jgi:hypothetical protein
MYRIRRNNQVWRQRWPWKHLYPPVVNDRFCRGCGLPFQDGPLPREVRQYQAGNTGAIVYPAGGFGRRPGFVVRCGRWKASGSKFFLSEFIPLEELADLLAILQKLQSETTAPAPPKLARR